MEDDEKGRAERRREAGSTKVPEGGGCGGGGRDGQTTMPCSSIGLSDHIRSRSEW